MKPKCNTSEKFSLKYGNCVAESSVPDLTVDIGKSTFLPVVYSGNLQLVKSIILFLFIHFLIFSKDKS